MVVSNTYTQDRSFPKMSPAGMPPYSSTIQSGTHTIHTRPLSKSGHAAPAKQLSDHGKDPPLEPSGAGARLSDYTHKTFSTLSDETGTFWFCRLALAEQQSRRGPQHSGSKQLASLHSLRAAISALSRLILVRLAAKWACKLPSR